MIVLLNVYICALRKKSVPLLPGGTIKYTLLAPWQIHRDRQGTNWNRQNWCCCQSKNFIRTRYTIRHLQTFRVISNVMPVLLLILRWCYFSCLKKYAEKFFNAFMSKCFLKSLWQRETASILWKIIAWTVKFSLANLNVSWRS